MGGAVPPLPQYAFMAWCSLRGAQGQLTFPLTSDIILVTGIPEKFLDE